jgi:2-phosphosulfolactate phosphatase
MSEAVFAQPGAGVRFDWGLGGATELGRVCRILVVVDVLSFSTTVDVAVSRGIRVYPFPWSDQAPVVAQRLGAEVAVGRSQVSKSQPWSLSPAALLSAPPVQRLVLPSPNGSAICAAAETFGVPVIAACLRNASAVAQWLRANDYGTRAQPIGVVAAGERWPDGTLRPSVEDLLGAALVIDGLAGVDGALSVEAAVTLAVLTGLPDLPAAVRGCVSGLELIADGYGHDVEIAGQVAASTSVPLLRNGFFSNAA